MLFKKKAYGLDIFALYFSWFKWGGGQKVGMDYFVYLIFEERNPGHLQGGVGTTVGVSSSGPKIVKD